IVVVLLCSCTKERTTIIHATLINKSGQSLKLIPYVNGQVLTDRILSFSNNDSIEIANHGHWGKVNHYGFDSDYISGMDSIIVKFNDNFSVTHYSYASLSPSDKHYQPDNSRNIFIGANYSWSYIDNSRYKRTNYHFYTFTEDDYNFAKD